MKSFGPPKLKFHAWIKNVQFWLFLRKVLGFYELLVMLGGKIRETPFFKVQSGETTACISYNFAN